MTKKRTGSVEWLKKDYAKLQRWNANECTESSMPFMICCCTILLMAFSFSHAMWIIWGTGVEKMKKEEVKKTIGDLRGKLHRMQKWELTSIDFAG